MERVERLWGLSRKATGSTRWTDGGNRTSETSAAGLPRMNDSTPSQPVAARVALDEQDDAALVVSCIAGAREAFDVLVRRHQRSVYHLCYRFLGNHEDASDAAQEVFLRAFRALQRFKGDASVSTWLYRIGVNACLNRLSARPPAAVSLDSVHAPSDPRPDAVTALLREERSARVRAAIDKLPPKQRATLILRVYHELPHAEIAEILGGSVGAVKANFFHALQNLKRILSADAV